MHLYHREALEITRIWHFLFNVSPMGRFQWVMYFRIMKALKKITSFECLQRNNSLGSLNSNCMNRRRTLKVRTITERGQVIRIHTSEAL